ncbi:MAG: hypothetical protein IJS96_01200 [Schwartzia sp.]|nr:hypothetical protein [Schwartzia sp. (in: firmicutes)]
MNLKSKLLSAALAALLVLPLAGCGGGSGGGGAKPAGGSGGGTSSVQASRGTPDTEPVDAAWQEALKKNGTFSEAFLRLGDIMQTGQPNHADDVKLPKGLQHASYDNMYHNKKYQYRDKDMQSAKNPMDMKQAAGRWVQVQEYVFPGMGMLQGHIANGFHLVLNADGTGTYDKYGGVDEGNYIKPVKWNDRTITLTFPHETSGHYSLEGNRLIYCQQLQAGIEEVYVFERESDFMAKLPLSPGMVLQLGGSPSDTAFSSNAIIDGPDLGKELPGQVYRLKQWSEGGKVTKADAKDPTTNPADHFIVLVKTGERGGYGYVRSGDPEDKWFFPLGDDDKYRQQKKDVSFAFLHDMFFYWDAKDGLTEYWYIERPGYGTEIKYGRLEVSGKTVKWYPRWYGGLKADLCLEYELAEGEKPPKSHIAVGPANSRKSFGIPEGPRTKAGFWRLDRIQGYRDFVKKPMTKEEREKAPSGPAEASSVEELQKIIDARFTYGEDARKYGADLWYVLEPDGTGYMRVWDKYFDLVWNDNEIYYYDVSGRHLLSIAVGSFYFDRGGAALVRLFKDELNPVPPRPKELGGKG